MTIPKGQPADWTVEELLGMTPEERLRLALVHHAEALRFHRAEVVLDLIDPTTVRRDGAGVYVGALDAVRALAEAEPYLVAPGPPRGADAGVRGEPVTADSPPDSITRALRDAAGYYDGLRDPKPR